MRHLQKKNAFPDASQNGLRKEMGYACFFLHQRIGEAKIHTLSHENAKIDPSSLATMVPSSFAVACSLRLPWDPPKVSSVRAGARGGAALGEMRGAARNDELGVVRRCRSVVIHGRHCDPLARSHTPVEFVCASTIHRCCLPSMPPVMPSVNALYCWRLPC
jgi:hypothetical protein